jgi:glycogen operon protein
MGYRLTGSSDLYASSARRPHASINFITAHDGFTLADLVSYNEKHNEANQEGEIPGESHNRSWNHGAEGPTGNPEINELRRRQQRNLLATLLLSQGVPMMLGGDEIGRTQQGNNNAYPQDNEISWFDWEHADAQLLEFTRSLIDLRQSHPVFRRRRWFLGRAIRGENVTDIGWFVPSGEPMSDADWANESALAMALFLGGEDLGVDQRGERITDSSFFLMLNASADPVQFTLPGPRWGARWRLILDTRDPDPARASTPSPVVVALPEAALEQALWNGGDEEDGLLESGAGIELIGRSMVLLERAD